MRFDSLKNSIYEYLKNQHYGGQSKISETSIGDYGRFLGYSASNAERRARELYSEGLFDRETRIIDKHGKKVEVAYYWYKTL